jgi:hypothetical protein
MHIYCTDTYIRVGQPTNATNAATINATADEGVATRTVPSGHCSLPHRFLFHPRQAGHKKHAKLGPALFLIHFHQFPPITLFVFHPRQAGHKKHAKPGPAPLFLTHFHQFPPITLFVQTYSTEQP